MREQEYEFVDLTGAEAQGVALIAPVVIRKSDIEAEIERLASLPAPLNGRRISMVAYPATGPGNGLAPGIAVSICVLKPGETTSPIRQNAFLVDFCIRGSGHTVIGEQRIDFTKYDVWTTPPWSTYTYFNNTDELQVRLSYSNSPLLEKLRVHVAEENPGSKTPATKSDDQPVDNDNKTSPYGTFQLTESGGYLMPYEKLINPDHIEIKALHWPWEKVKDELDKLKSLGNRYAGRRLYLMYDPATSRTNGTTLSFFATITIRPGNIVDRPHRHISAAINYYFQGSGYSTVEGKRYEWDAGDLMLSAPGWAVHNHASKEQDVYELTIQDQPMHLALGSLLWHEDLRDEPKLLGLKRGFATNRAAFTEVLAGK